MESSRDFGKMEGRFIQVNEGELKKHVSEIVRESVEDTLNSLLEAEADSLCQARRYERNAERASTRAGLPHARGGVSVVRASAADLGVSSPRPWGCFLSSVWAALAVMVFPTPVGVFL